MELAEVVDLAELVKLVERAELVERVELAEQVELVQLADIVEPVQLAEPLSELAELAERVSQSRMLLLILSVSRGKRSNSSHDMLVALPSVWRPWRIAASGSPPQRSYCTS